MDNLVTLCSECHMKIHKKQLTFNKKVKTFKHESHMNIMRKRLIKSLKSEFTNVYETFGYLTKYLREKLGIVKSHSSYSPSRTLSKTTEKLGIVKSHCNDAFVISHNLEAKQSGVEYLFKKVRRHNRQIHKSKPSKGGKRRKNQSPYIINGFRRYDKVMCGGIECFITGKRSSGYFQLKSFDGTVISQGANSKKLKLLEPIKGWLVNWRMVIPPRPKEVEESLPK